MGDIAARKEIDRLISEINAAAERGHATLVTPKLRHFMNTQVSELTAEQDRNRELTRQVEQLQARVDAAEKLLKIGKPFLRGLNSICPNCGRAGGFHYRPCPLGDALENYALALTAPPSSSDPGRADTEKT